MSRLRISHKPGEGGWFNEGPSSVRQSTHIGGEMVVGAPTPGAKNDPWILAYRNLTKDTEAKKAKQRAWKAAQRERRREARIHTAWCKKVPDHRSDCTARPAPQLCGFVMKIAKEPCARVQGHAGHHATRAWLDHQNEWRRTTWRPRQAAA